MEKWRAIGCIFVVLGIIRVIYQVMTAQIIGKILIGIFVSILSILILYFGTEKRHYAFFITSVLFFAKLIVGVLETYPKLCLIFVWFKAGVVLVITGMILFYLRKGTEKAIKMGEHQLDVPRSFGGRYVEAWQIYLSRKRNIKMVIENGRV